MANLEGMQEKFIVLKNEDLIGALQGEDNDNLRESFKAVLYAVALYRQKQGKESENNYLVVNTDESYADEVIEILKRNGHWG